jgi:hypothetical protein
MLRRAARLIPPLNRLRQSLIEQAATISVLGQRVRDLAGRVKEQDRLLSLATGGSAALHDHARHYRAATRRAALLGRSEQTIVVGPWCGEVGFELLYWIPFLRWLAERARIDRQRIIVLTRGGAGVWYRDLASRSVEIFDLIDPSAFRDHADTWKQHRLSAFDRRLIDGAMADTGLRRVRLLHPQIMYRLFTAYWKENPVVEPIAAFLRYGALPWPPRHHVTAALPADYVAAKFYFSQSFPDTAANREFVRQIVGATAEQMPVVLLSAGARLDDHHDAPVGAGANVHLIHSDVRDNLAAQSAVVAGARRFIGTYGGFSYLAPFYGVDSLSFYSARDRLVPFHLDHAHRVFGSRHDAPRRRGEGAGEAAPAPGRRLGRFVALDVADAAILNVNETLHA